MNVFNSLAYKTACSKKLEKIRVFGKNATYLYVHKNYILWRFLECLKLITACIEKKWVEIKQHLVNFLVIVCLRQRSKKKST